MTLPTDIIFPLRPDQIRSGGANLELYIRDLVNSLTDMYQDVVQVVNGTLQEWTPVAYGLTTEGTGTYSHQTGWYLRQGLMVDLWFDIAWTAHTGTGNLAIRLPYLAAKSNNSPWVGVIESSGNSFAGYSYLTWRVEPNTIQGSIIKCGTGVASAGQSIAATGNYKGHIRYVGQQFEN